MPIADLDLRELAGALRRGEVSARAATTACLDALDAMGRDLNCTVAVDRAAALAKADAADSALSEGRVLGPLHGVPMAHKDLFDIEGRIVAAGSKVRGTYRARGTASVIRRLDAAGAISCGALHMSELAMSPTGYNAHLGACRNPWNPDYVTGGSSSGSAAAVAARVSVASLGSDTGGSARVPAGACGVTGLKPTYGLVGKDGVTPLAPSLDCVSPIARSAADCAILMDIIAGPEPQDPATAAAPRIQYSSVLGRESDRPGTLGVLSPQHLAKVDPEIRDILETALQVFRALGWKTTEVEIADHIAINVLNRTILTVEAATLHRRDIAERPEAFSAHVRSRLQVGLHLPATRYVEAQMLRGKLARRFIAETFDGIDLLFMPCIPVPVPTLAEVSDGTAGTGSRDIMDFTRAMNYLGVPALSLPAGFTANGLPASLQLVGRHFDERRILAAGIAYQQATDWHRRRPPVSAVA